MLLDRTQDEHLRSPGSTQTHRRNPQFLAPNSQHRLCPPTACPRPGDLAPWCRLAVCQCGGAFPPRFARLLLLCLLLLLFVPLLFVPLLFVPLLLVPLLWRGGGGRGGGGRGVVDSRY